MATIELRESDKRKAVNLIVKTVTVWIMYR